MAKNLLASLEEDIALAQDLEFSTEDLQIPPMDAPGAVIGVSRRHFNKDGNDYYQLSIRWEVDSEEAREAIKRDKALINQDLFINIDREASLYLEEEDANDQLWVIPEAGNPDFGKLMKWATSVGYVRPTGWAKFWVNLEDDLKGKEAQIKISERWQKTKEDDEEGNPIKVKRSYVRSVAKLD